MTKEERAKYLNAMERSHAYGEQHERTGMNSMFTGSKAYTCLPRFYKKEEPRGKGIYVGPQFSPQWVVEPKYGTARSTIHELVFVKKEAEGQERPAIDHGNQYESTVLEVYKKLNPHCEIHVPGRIVATHPAYRDWMSATPDGLCYDPKTGKAYVLEIKCLYAREFEFNGPTPERVFRPIKITHPIADFKDEEVDFTFEGVHQQDGALIPGHYAFQLLLESFCSGIPCVRFIQFLTGGAYRLPMISVTEWEFDQRLFSIMSVYWKAAWDMGLKAREELRTILGKQEEARKKGDMEAVARYEDLVRYFEDNCPWPAPKKGRPDMDAVKYMPNIFACFVNQN